MDDTGEMIQSVQQSCLVLTLCNPAYRNALGPRMYEAGLRAIQEVAQRSDIKAVIITGHEGVFCAGGNLQRLLKMREQDESVVHQSVGTLHTWIQAIRACPKPVIAAVEGPAAGAGFSLALACDLLVAAQDAQFVMAYSSVALSPDGGGAWALARAMPRAWVNEVLMLGGRLKASELHAHGFVNRLCEPGQALAQAFALAQQLGERAPNALTSIKTLTHQALEQDLREYLNAERDHITSNLHHANGKIGIEAFLEKKKPQYLSK